MCYVSIHRTQKLEEKITYRETKTVAFSVEKNIECHCAARKPLHDLMLIGCYSNGLLTIKRLHNTANCFFLWKQKCLSCNERIQNKRRKKVTCHIGGRLTGTI